MLRRGFNGSRPRTCGLSITVGARAESAQASRRLFANAGAAPPSSGGGGGRAFGVLVGAAVGASAWTGYQYYTDPSFRSRLHDFWASLSSPTATTSKPAPPSPASPDHPLADTVGSAHAAEPALSGNGGAEAVPLLATQALLAPTDETGAQDVHEEAVVTMPDSLVAAAASEPAPEVEAGLSPLAGVPASPSEEEEKTEEEEEERAEQQAPVLAAPLVLVVVEEEEEEEEKEGEEVIPTKATDAQHSGARAEEATSATQPAAVPAAVVALVTESFAASDAHQEAIAAAAAHDVDYNVRAKDHGTPADTTPDDAHNQDKSEEEPKQREQHVTDGPTRLQELQAIKEIIAIQAESCERQVREKVERLRQKYEQKLAVLRQNMEEVVAEQVDVERQKIHDDLQHRLDQQLDSLERQYSEERQRVYAEMEDLVAGLNARFVELVREEKQLLTEQLDESARSHAQTLAYLQTLVEDAQYRTEHLRQEREWWSWTERLTSAVRALESAALGPDGHLLPFQAELDIVRSLAATRPLYKAVGPHIEAQASRGVYSVGRLRERFEQVEKHVRVAALVPEGGGLLRHAVAPLLAATVSLNPYHTPTQQELLLNSARRHLQDDDLLTALVDMEQLTGLARELAHDWIEEARKRLVVEQAISVIAADLTTLKPPTDL